MRQTLRILITISPFLLALNGICQPSSQDATTILRASLLAQIGRVSVRDVSVTGTAESIAGASDETSSFTFRALASGSTLIELNQSSGLLRESRLVSSGTSGAWSRDGQTSHAIAGHNLMVDGAWWFPAFIVQRLLSDQKAVINLLDIEDGLAHLRAYESAPSGWSDAAVNLNTKLTQIDLYLDPKTFLPVRLSFTIHPDDNAQVDIPITVQFFDYQQVAGILAPMHIEKYVNGTLALDLHGQNAVVNAGLDQSEFAAH